MMELIGVTEKCGSAKILMILYM